MEKKNPQEFLEELCNLCKKYSTEIYIGNFNDDSGYEENSMTFNHDEVINLFASPWRGNIGIKETKEYTFEAKLTPALSLEA